MTSIPGYDQWKTAEPPGDDYPTMQCPKCHKVYEDMDGFGVMYCPPSMGGCGYCKHASITDGECGFCGERVRED